MKKILLLTLSLITHVALVAQCDPDLSPPTFTLPLELTEGIVYPCLDSVPTHSDITTLVYMTLSDSCMGPNIPPCYCGPTLQSLSEPFELTDTSITYQYIAYDWQDPTLRNWTFYEYITFYFESISCTTIDTIPPTIQCPETIISDTDFNLCGAIIPNIGFPIVNDNIGILVVVAEELLDIYPIGTTDIIWIVYDSTYNIASCIQSILVVDDQFPTIECEDDQTILIAPGSTEVSVEIQSPIALDNCTEPSIINDFNNTSDASGLYPLGTTLVTWTATDISNFTAFCNQYITVEIDSTSLGIPKWQWNDVKVYPNPSDGNFTILSKYDYQILNYMGIIQNEDSLNNGVYLIRIGGKISKTKLVIQK